MAKQFEIIFEESGSILVADMFEDKAPITCENFWNSIVNAHREQIHHVYGTGPEMWCFVPKPAEVLPYENCTVFPEHGDILYYHYVQPATREGEMVYDIGIYWDRGRSKLLNGWTAGNLFARVNGQKQIDKLRVEAGKLLMEARPGKVMLRRKG